MKNFIKFKDWLKLQEEQDALQQAPMGQPAMQFPDASKQMDSEALLTMRQKQGRKMNKFIGLENSNLCGECGKFANPTGVKQNPKHLYPLGIWYQCPCGSTKFWCNSVRNEDELRQYLAGQKPSYNSGFCYDTYCGFCWTNGSLKNMASERLHNGLLVDHYQCKSCPQNQNLLIKTIDGTPAKLIQFYEKHLPNVKKGGMFFQTKRWLFGGDQHTPN